MCFTLRSVFGGTYNIFIYIYIYIYLLFIYINVSVPSFGTFRDFSELLGLRDHPGHCNCRGSQNGVSCKVCLDFKLQPWSSWKSDPIRVKFPCRPMVSRRPAWNSCLGARVCCLVHCSRSKEYKYIFCKPLLFKICIYIFGGGARMPTQRAHNPPTPPHPNPRPGKP